ncbi:hypothetical protein SALBM311S_08577 [Streptomyces alboniger]
MPRMKTSTGRRRKSRPRRRASPEFLTVAAFLVVASLVGGARP